MEESVIFKIEINRQEGEEDLKSLKKSSDDLRKSNEALENSIEGLSKANKALREERKKLDTSTVAGKSRIQEINKEIDKNNKVIKENSSALEKQRLNVGNYGGALDKLVPGLGATTQGIIGATRASLAFIATPLGAILAAIGVAVGAVIVYFKQFESVLDVIENVITQVTAVISSLIQNLDKVASIIGDVFTGNFSAAADTVRELGDAMADAATEAQKLLDLTRELEDAELKYRIANAAAANQIKAWVLAAKNRNLTQEEATALLQKASDLENQVTAEAVANAQKRADIEERTLVASKKAQLDAIGVVRGAAETQFEFINRLIESGVFSPEELDPLISAYEKVQQEASAGLALQEKISNDKVKLLEQELAEEKRIEAEREKLRADRLKAEDDEAAAYFQRIQNKIDAELAALERRKEFELEFYGDGGQIDLINKNFDKRIVADTAARNKKLNEEDNKRTAYFKAKKDAELAIANQVSSGIIAIAGRESALGKTLALVQIGVNSAVGIAKAVQAGAGLVWPANIAAIGSGIAAVVTGIAQAKSVIAGFAKGGLIEGFATGGITGTKIQPNHGTPINRSNGDNRLVTVKTGEVILNEDQQRRAGGDRFFERLGVPGFATGGAVDYGRVSRQSEELNAQREIFNAIAQIKPYVTVEDINVGQNRVQVVESRAVVI